MDKDLKSHKKEIVLNVVCYTKHIQRLPVKMAEQVNAVLASFHNHIRITAKLQSSCHWESPGVQLNGNPTPGDMQRIPTQHWQEEWRHGSGWSHTCMWQLIIEGDVSAAEVPLVEQRVPGPTPHSPAQNSSAGKRSPHNF